MRRKRTLSDSIEVDQSLRQSRAIFMTMAVVNAILAATGIVFIVLGMTQIADGLMTSSSKAGLLEPIVAVVSGVVFVCLEYAIVGQVRECSRRLKVLREDPTKNVKPMPAPFQDAIFGRY